MKFTQSAYLSLRLLLSRLKAGLLLKLCTIAICLQLISHTAFSQYTKLLNFAGGTEVKEPNGVLTTDGIFLYGCSFHGGTSDMGTIYKIKPDGTGYLKIHDFTGVNGKSPEGSLYYDGTFLYGMTYTGGTSDFGVIYKIMPDGSNYQKLLDFNGANGNGPYGTFVTDGTYLYAMTWSGGANNLGRIFRILPDGSGYQGLLDFAGASNGGNPGNTLYYDYADGVLYGMTAFGGANGFGTVFKINTNGTGYDNLHDFTGGVNGKEPYGALISDGTYLYGLTYSGGTSDLGTAFRIMPDGTNFSKILDFTGTATGSNPYTTLTLKGSYLYGLAAIGGGSNLGTLFRLKPDGTGFTRLHSFSAASSGSKPYGTLFSMGPYLFGVASEGGTSGNGTFFKYEIQEPFDKLLDFTGRFNGLVPYGSLYSDGTYLYGMNEEGGLNDIGTLFKIKPDGTEYYKLLDFAGTTNGSSPKGSLISDGIFLYGMTYQGGTSNFGTVFKIMPDGTGYAKLHDFNALANGVYPEGDLYYDGTWLYGMTSNGGANSRGTIFKIMPDGTGYAKVSEFAAPFNGSQPLSSLYSDGTFFYGTTRGGGAASHGTIFKIMPDGTNLTKLLDFGVGTNGRKPEGSFSSDGTWLYGTTSQGGVNNYGALFKIKPDGTGYTNILSFDNNVYGSSPQGTPLLVGEFLYALTYVGGPNFEGTVFKIKTDGTNFSKVHQFSSIVSGSYPLGCSLITDGTYFYGMTNSGGLKEGTVFRLRDIPENNTLLSFTGIANGSEPTYNKLICDGTTLYGMTTDGGPNDNGVIFKMNSDGTSFTKLYDFGVSPDGRTPEGALYFDGTFLYGMTYGGGASGIANDGTIFKIKPDGTAYSKIFDFNGTATGTNPWGSLTSDGIFLYGMTSNGGTGADGTVFKILTDGTGFVKMHDFAASAGNPVGDLTLVGTTLFGMTYEGGAADDGVLFKINTDGTGFANLHEFGWPDGDRPYTGALVYDGTFLYGMTELGGAHSDGTIFKIKPDGTGYLKLHDFQLPTAGIPQGGLELVGNKLYGLTVVGGPSDMGTLFEIGTNGSGYQTLMEFDGIATGYDVLGTLCHCNDALYGMTTAGGSNDLGTIFKYVIPAAPPGIPTITSFSPGSGPIGTSVTITGTNFSSTPTNNTVQFNGTAATVTASSATSITTTVPIGASTGTITVTVAGNTATSATTFTVTTAQNFITQWNLATTGSGATQLSFGTATSGTVNYTWQEISPGSASGSGSWSGATLTITGLPTAATIRLQIAPTNFQRVIINNGSNRNRLTHIETWGSTAWTSMQNAFYGCANLQVTATDVPNLSGVSDMSAMFRQCINLNSPGNIGSWNTGAVTNMLSMFESADAFNQPIGTWNTGAVTNMQGMFSNTDTFNQNIGAWNTGAVTNMANMFSSARAFNQNIGAWNTAAVTNMSGMFFFADTFNQDIGVWNTSAVTNMSDMFTEAYVFNQNIGAWNTAAVTNMASMFSEATVFNQNIGSWNTAAVTDMSSMFSLASAFNQNISLWNTGAVKDMTLMFSRAIAFNQNINLWNTGAVTSMLGMFQLATAFNQNIGAWTLNPAVDLRFMLNDNGMDCNNYSATLIGWSANPSTPNGRILEAIGRQYGTNAVAARTNLRVTKGWSITSDTPSGTVCSSLPTIASFTPSSGPVGTTVTITGTNFSTTPASNTVQFNGTAATVTASTATSITVTVPIGATTGAITVTIAGSTATSATNFTVTAPPTITLFTPSSGQVGITVTITGTNFSTTTASNTVQFNGTAAIVTASTATIITVTVPIGATTGAITVTVAGSTATSATNFTVTTPAGNPPVINSATTATTIGGTATIPLDPLLSDPDNNLDLTTLKIVAQPEPSGAPATIDAGRILTIDYTGISFSGTDEVVIEVCDLTANCVQSTLSIDVVGNIVVYNALSPGSDGKNDVFFLQFIDILESTKNNKVLIFNRWGDIVWEGKNYDNSTVVFTGLNKNGNELPTGTYFYKITFSDAKAIEGFISLKR